MIPAFNWSVPASTSIKLVPVKPHCGALKIKVPPKSFAKLPGLLKLPSTFKVVLSLTAIDKVCGDAVNFSTKFAPRVCVTGFATVPPAAMKPPPAT